MLRVGTLNLGPVDQALLWLRYSRTHICLPVRLFMLVAVRDMYSLASVRWQGGGGCPGSRNSAPPYLPFAAPAPARTSLLTSPAGLCLPRHSTVMLLLTSARPALRRFYHVFLAHRSPWQQQP